MADHLSDDEVDAQARVLLGQLDEPALDVPPVAGSFRPTAIALVVCDHNGDVDGYQRVLSGATSGPSHIMALVWALAEVGAAGYRDAAAAGVDQANLTWLLHRHVTAEPVGRIMGAVAFDLVHGIAAQQRDRSVQLLADLLVTLRARKDNGCRADTDALIQALTAGAHHLLEAAGAALQLEFDELVQTYGRVIAT